jgi:hypothetical protein
MMHRFFLHAHAIVAIVLAIGDGARAQPPTTIEQVPAREEMQAARRFAYAGVASCTAKACHGDVRADDAHPNILGNEFAVWAEGDRHSRAYRTLLENPLSLEMTLRLGWKQKPSEAKECLACHAPSDAARAPSSPPLSDGVGCESCHGPAEKWLAEHTLASWLSKPPADRAKVGFKGTKNLADRAAVCAACHVGDADREVSHDLIAAGHPALKFEIGAYQWRLPKHWSERQDYAENGPDFQARLWAAGQYAGAAAALELSASRIERAARGNPGTTWPELAEYDCFACHQDLVAERAMPADLPGTRPLARRLGGWPDWNPWHAAAFSREFFADAKLDSPNDLLERLSAPFVDVNDAGDIRRASRRLYEEARRLADPNTSLPLADWSRALVVAARDAPPHWDSAAQTYLGLAAIEQSLLDRGGPPAASDAARRKLLRQFYHEALPHARRASAPAGGQRVYPLDRKRLAEVLMKLQDSFEH